MQTRSAFVFSTISIVCPRSITLQKCGGWEVSKQPSRHTLISWTLQARGQETRKAETFGQVDASRLAYKIAKS